MLSPTPSHTIKSTEKMNGKNNSNKKDKQMDQQIQYDFCKVCKFDHNQGRRHIYFPNHKKSLALFLSRFQSKLTDISFFLKNPLPLRPEHASRNRLWCVFCDCDILEGDGSFACGNAIEHLASVEHLKEVKDFMWRYGGDSKRVDSFRISESDYAKWRKKCLLQKDATVEGAGVSIIGPTNDIQNETNSNCSNSSYKNDVFSVGFDFNFLNGVMPLPNHTNENRQILPSQISGVASDLLCSHDICGEASMGALMANGLPKGSSVKQKSLLPFLGDHPASRFPNNGDSSVSTSSLILSVLQGFKYFPWTYKMYPCERTVSGGTSSQSTSYGESDLQGSQKLTQISFSARGDGEGNVHSGAPPPWLSVSERNGEHTNLKAGKETVKPSRLNPKRVGAAWAERRKIELELEQKGELVSNSYEADWLPNFGRVWQSGSRKESRKEFQAVNKSLHITESQEENPIQLQPYISKRMRRDSGEGNASATAFIG